jgi:hypothetical protein
MAQNFSGALKIMDLDDFIAPAQVSPRGLAARRRRSSTAAPLLAPCAAVAPRRAGCRIAANERLIWRRAG